MDNKKYDEYMKGAEGEPKVIRLNFGEKEPGYDILVALRKRYNTVGVKAVVADALTQFVK